MRRARFSSVLALLALVIGLVAGCGDKEPASPDKSGAAGEKAPPSDTARSTPGDAVAFMGLRKEIAAAVGQGRTYLLGQQEAAGGFGDKTMKVPGNVAFTSMAVTGLVGSEEAAAAAADEAVTKGLTFLAGFQQPNGSIVDDPKWTNYSTSASISAFAAARRSAFSKVQAKAAAYLEASQIQGDPKQASFGGFPYKAEQSADASNAFIAASALDANGLAKDSEVRKRVGHFVSHLINNSEANTGEVEIKVDGEKRIVVSGVDHGGFYRSGESKAGMVKRSDGKWELRSYGSMTYAALKLMMFAGIAPKDPRVTGVVGWISKHWTVKRNPGFENAEKPEQAGQQGIFYFLYTATRALIAYEQATGEPLVVTDADGRKHDWRAAIAAELLMRQNDDGSWNNPVDRWMEGSKTLATSFALQTFGWLSGRLK